MIQRLPFLLKDFTSPPMWVSEQARAYWEPRFKHLLSVCVMAERWAVADGQKPSCLQNVSPDELIELHDWLATFGLQCTVLSKVKKPTHYTTTFELPDPGEPFDLRVAIYKDPKLAFLWVNAWKDQDDSRIASLLGYPVCCTDFYIQKCKKDQMVDTTWEMAFNSISSEVSGEVITFEYSPEETNILLRWIGLRPVFHLPCSFQCGETIKIATELRQCLSKYGLKEDIDSLYEILSWPVEWSALHGALELRTPVFKLVSRTDATPIKYVVKRQGKEYPLHGASGIVFPFRRATIHPPTESVAFAAAFHSPSLWKENGFTSLQAMDESHSPILSTFRRHVTPQISGFKNILDLGCGNGHLLYKIDLIQTIDPTGVDLNKIAIERAKKKWGRGTWIVADLHSFYLWEGKHYDYILLMPGRISEHESEATRLRTIRACLRRSSYLLVYGYQDNIEMAGGFLPLITKSGIPVSELLFHSGNNYSQAAVLVSSDVLSRLDQGSEAST